MYDRMIQAAAKWEQRLGRLPMAYLVGFLLLILAGIYVRPAIHTVVLGNHYAWLAEDPIHHIGGNRVGYRMLTPLISWLLGLGGQGIIITNLLIATALLGTVYYCFSRKLRSAGEALYAAGMIAFSMVTLSTVYYGGYCDALTYLLVFLMWWLRADRLLFYVLFLLAMINRESALFLIPWFAYLRMVESDRKWLAGLELLVGFVGVGVVFLFYRQWVDHMGVVAYDASHYLEPLLEDPLIWIRRSFASWGIGFFSVFKALWLIPIAAVWDMWRKGLRRDLIALALLLVGVWLQLVIAFDTSRMLTLAFPIMLVSLLHLFETNAARFREWALPIFWINLLAPQLYTANNIIEIMHSTPGNIVMMLFFGKANW